MTTQCVQVKLEFGHNAQIRTKPTSDGFTHDWDVFVRGSEGNEIHHCVEKVVFLLHESFNKPKRVIKEPPFRVAESGYGGFTMPIDVYFKNKEEPKKVSFTYDLFLHVDGEPPVNHVRWEKLTFRNPTEDFRRKLLLSGGVGVLNDGGVPPGAHFGLESAGTSSSSGPIENRTVSKGKPGSVSANVPQKKLKTAGAPMKDPNKSTSSKPTKDGKEGKGASKESKASSKGPSKVAAKRPSSSGPSSEPSLKRKKEHSVSSKGEKIKSSSEKSVTDDSRRESSFAKKGKTLPKASVKKDKNLDLFAPEITVEHRAKAEPEHKPSLPPFEEELSTGEVDEPDSPSSKSTGSFSSLPRGGGSGRALETLMAEIDDDNEDDDDQDYSIPFKRDLPKPSYESPENDSSSSDSDYDQISRQKPLKKGMNSPGKKTQKVNKKVTKVEKKPKTEAKTKVVESKKTYSKPKDADARGKGPEVKKKAGNDKSKASGTKSKGTEKKESKTVESKAKPSTDTKPKKVDKPKLENRKKSVDSKNKGVEGKSKSEPKVKNSDSKSKENSKEQQEKKGGPAQTNNMDYLYELVDLHKRLMALKDREKLQKVVDLIGETGDFKITDKTFDFDLCSLDKPTVRKLQEYVPPL